MASLSTEGGRTMTTQKHLPKIKARRGFTKAQRVAIVTALHGVTPDEAEQLAIQLDDEPVSLLKLRTPKQAHNLYYYLTGLSLFEEDYGWAKYKHVGSWGSGNQHREDWEIIPREADKAMRLYGNPEYAAIILEAQLETVKANGLDIPRLAYSVISELQRRAKGHTLYNYDRWRSHDIRAYRLDSELKRLGPPLTAIGKSACAP